VPRLCLVGGPPSTGSTLFARMLAAHPQMFCGPETHLFSHPGLWRHPGRVRWMLAHKLIGWPLPPRLVPLRKVGRPALTAYGWRRPALLREALRADDIQDFAERFYRPAAADRRVAAEKSPANAFALPTALALGGLEKAIAMVRNGPDVVASLLRRGTSVHVACARWVVAMNLIAEAQQSVGADRLLVVRYEALVADPQAVAREVCAFLEVADASAAMVARGGGGSTLAWRPRMAGWRADAAGPIVNVTGERQAPPATALARLLRMRPEEGALKAYGVTGTVHSGAALLQLFGYEVPSCAGAAIGEAQPERNGSARFIAQLVRV